MLHTRCAKRMAVYCALFMLGDAVMNTNDDCFSPPVSLKFTGKDIKQNKSKYVIGTHDK